MNINGYIDPNNLIKNDFNAQANCLIGIVKNSTDNETIQKTIEIAKNMKSFQPEEILIVNFEQSRALSSIAKELGKRGRFCDGLKLMASVKDQTMLEKGFVSLAKKADAKQLELVFENAYKSFGNNTNDSYINTMSAISMLALTMKQQEIVKKAINAMPTCQKKQDCITAQEKSKELNELINSGIGTKGSPKTQNQVQPQPPTQLLISVQKLNQFPLKFYAEQPPLPQVNNPNIINRNEEVLKSMCNELKLHWNKYLDKALAPFAEIELEAFYNPDNIGHQYYKDQKMPFVTSWTSENEFLEFMQKIVADKGSIPYFGGIISKESLVNDVKIFLERSNIIYK